MNWSRSLFVYFLFNGWNVVNVLFSVSFLGLFEVVSGRRVVVVVEDFFGKMDEGGFW